MQTRSEGGGKNLNLRHVVNKTNQWGMTLTLSEWEMDWSVHKEGVVSTTRARRK